MTKTLFYIYGAFKYFREMNKSMLERVKFYMIFLENHAYVISFRNKNVENFFKSSLVVKRSPKFKFISFVGTKLLTTFTNLQAFIRVLLRLRNFVVISGTNESLRDQRPSVLTAHTHTVDNTDNTI